MAVTGVEVPAFGFVNICIGTDAQPGCLLQAARDAGCLLPGEAAQLRRENEELGGQVEALTKALKRHPDVVGATTGGD